MRLDLFLIAVITVSLMAWLAWQTRQYSPAAASVTLSSVLGPSDEGFEKVSGPMPLQFPADHAAHEAWRSEWWYFTGNLRDQTGRPFGFQFTLFRLGLGSVPVLDSAWSSDQLWMAHLALSDIEQQRFYSAERFARGALGLAGATADQWWLGSWSVERQGNHWHLDAQDQAYGLTLELGPIDRLVLQGRQGYSRKGPDPDNASYYYSVTRLPVTGRIRRHNETTDETINVSGNAWLDREWGSNQLADGVTGWDWFAVHLDDGRDLMIYRLRLDDGTSSPFSAGVLVASGHDYQTLGHSDFSASARRWWRDDQNTSWPVAWQISLPAHELDLLIEPAFDGQLWRRSVRYWEGSVRVLDANSDQIIGTGYLELSGYGENTSSPRR